MDYGTAPSPDVLKVTSKRPKPVNSGMFGPELVNSSNPVVMKWEVCGGKTNALVITVLLHS